MPKDWNRRLTELEEQVLITKKKAELQKLIDKKQAKKPKAAAPAKKATKPKVLRLKATKAAAVAAAAPRKRRLKAIEEAPGSFVLMLPNGTAVPVSLGRTVAAAAGPKVIEPP